MTAPPGYDFARARTAIVTGGGSGIGRALCLGLARRAVRALVVADVELSGAEETAEQVRTLGVGARAARCDVSKEAEVDRLIAEAEAREGTVDAFFANAGVGLDHGPVDALSWEAYRHSMAVNVDQAVLAARRLLPSLAERQGCFAVTSSAAGVLLQLGSVAYTATKHAARAVAEWMAITYGAAGLHVACLCPQAVKTKMTAHGTGVAGIDGTISADAAAESLLRALEAGKFLALPHPEVEKYMKRKADDLDRWILGMQRAQMQLLGPVEKWPKPKALARPKL